MGWLAVVVFGQLLHAAPDMPRGFFRGHLDSVEGTAAQGHLIAHTADGAVSSCAYDARTYIELDKSRVTAVKLQPGDPIEIVADYRPGMRTCYARTVHVVPPPPSPQRAAKQLQAKARREPLFPRGDRTLAGLVTKLDANEVTLRMRGGEEQTLSLRSDTRYTGEGHLSVNRHVSIRAGRNMLSGALEAFQVMWGELAGQPSN